MPVYSYCLQILCTLITHLFHGLPLFHISSILAVTICFGIPWLCFLSLYPCNLYLGDFINFTVSTPYNMPCTSLLVLNPCFLLLVLGRKFFLQSSFSILQEYLFLLMSFFRLLMSFIEVSKLFASVFRDSLDTRRSCALSMSCWLSEF